MNKYSVLDKAGMRELQQKRSRERGFFLYDLRVQENMTLQEAAAKIGVHKSTLCRYEQGLIREIQEDVAARICRIYHITREELRKGCRAEEQRTESVTESRENRELETGRGMENLLLTEEEFLRIYRELDDRTKLRVQFLAGAVRKHG